MDQWAANVESKEFLSNDLFFYRAGCYSFVCISGGPFCLLIRAELTFSYWGI